MSADILSPGDVIRPSLSPGQAGELLTKLYGLTAKSVKEFNSYDDRNFYFTVAETAEEKADIWPDGYILKVTNRQDSRNLLFSDAQNKMILHMSAAGLAVPVPVTNLEGDLQSLELLEGGGTSSKNIVRLLRFIPGKTLYEVDPWTPAHFSQCGEFIAKMDLALASFRHPGYTNRNSIWYLSSVPDVKQFLFAVEDDVKRKLAEEIITEFSVAVKPVEDQLEKSVIHGDFNEQNILCRQNSAGQQEIFSVIDFGDSNYNPLLYELGITIMYMMTKCSLISPNLAGGHVIAGYIKHRDLTSLERKLVRTCVAARYAQSLVMGAYSYSQDPGNEYLLITSRTGWETLSSFWRLSEAELYAGWDQVISSYFSPGQHDHYLTSPSPSQ